VVGMDPMVSGMAGSWVLGMDGMDGSLDSLRPAASEGPATGRTGFTSRTGAQLTREVAMMICAIVWKGRIFMEGV
jgi:hypothetical protein